MVCCCCVCLVSDNIKSFDIFECGLHAAYEDLTGMQIPEHSERFSRRICSYCRSLLLKCVQFKNKCKNAHWSMKLMGRPMIENNMVTKDFDNELYRQHNLTVSEIIKLNVTDNELDIKEESEKNVNDTKPVFLECNDNIELSSEVEECEVFDDDESVDHPENNDALDVEEEEIDTNNVQTFLYCQQCWEIFDTESLKNHMATHIKIINNDHCYSIRETHSESQVHNNNTVNRQNDSYSTRTCDQCGATFTNGRLYKKHLNSHRKNRKINCKICNRIFKEGRALTVHNKHAHMGVKFKKRQSKYPLGSVCEVCGLQWKSNAAFEYHMRTHTGEKPFKCTECPKSFATKTPLQIHIRTHTGERPYKCTDCPKTFRDHGALGRHYRIHTGSRPYPCTYCAKKFTQSNSLKLHVLTVHMKMPCPYKKKRRKLKNVENE